MRGALSPFISVALGVPTTHAGAQDGQPASGSGPPVDVYVAASSPAEEHERLAALTGAWRVQGRYRFNADKGWRQFSAREPQR